MSVRNALLSELYETIINFLADEDKSLSSIKACSLVSHEFLPLARKHIFGTVKVNVPSPAALGGSYETSGNPKKLVNILTCSPAIAKHVHTLKLCIRRELFDIKELPRVLKLFTKLKNLAIYEYPNHNFIPLDFPLPWKEAIFHLLYLPTLTHLMLGPICGFVLSDLAHCSKLKYISIRNVHFAPIHLEAQRFCTIYYEYEETDDDLSTGHNTDEVLVISLNSYHAKEVALDKGLRNKVKALFAQCSQLQDIRIFKIDYGENLVLIQGFAEMILPSLQTLQHIHIHTQVTEYYDDPLGGLPTELAAIAGKNIIETISIDMMVQTDHRCKTGDEWGALDRALTRRRSEWPKLESVSLTIEVANFFRKEGTLEDVLRKLPENQLMGLATSNDIKFSLEVTSYLV